MKAETYPLQVLLWALSGWGYCRIQRELRKLGHRVATSTIAKVLKDNGIKPGPDRPSSWKTFLQAHWGEIAGMPRSLLN